MAELKILEESSRISKLEAQVEAIKEDVNELKSDVKDLHSRITTGNREIMDKIDSKFDALNRSENAAHSDVHMSIEKLSSRVEALEKWRWMIVGGAIVLGYLAGNMDMAKFFK